MLTVFKVSVSRCPWVTPIWGTLSRPGCHRVSGTLLVRDAHTTVRNGPTGTPVPQPRNNVSAYRGPSVTVTKITKRWGGAATFMGTYKSTTQTRKGIESFTRMMTKYLLIFIIPFALINLYIYINIGPADLAEIPEGYEPHYWEYCRHPWQRFIARYCLPSPQQTYEITLHELYKQQEQRKSKMMKQAVNRLMDEEGNRQYKYDDYEKPEKLKELYEIMGITEPERAVKPF